MQEKSPSFLKIVYFDEAAAQDYLDITNGGRLDWSKEENRKRVAQILAEIEAQAKGGFNIMCISALVSNSRNGNSAGQPGEELVGCASAVEAEAVFVQVTLEQLTSTMVSSGQEYLQIA